jgi:hypothetical protein
MTLLLGIFVGYFFKSNDMTQIDWESEGKLKMPIKKTKGFICFEMLEEG